MSFKAFWFLPSLSKEAGKQDDLVRNMRSYSLKISLF